MVTHGLLYVKERTQVEIIAQAFMSFLDQGALTLNRMIMD